MITGVRKFGVGSRIFIALTFLFLPLAILENYEIWIFRLHLNPISKENYAWLCSTIAQSMSALFGIGGVFAAYIFQMINKKINEAYLDGRRLAGPISFLSDTSNDEFLPKLDEFIKFKMESDIGPDRLKRLRKAKETIERIKDLKDILIITFRIVIIFMTSVIFLSLIALPFSHYLSSLTFGFLFGIFILILTLTAILKMVRFIKASVHF